MYDFESNDFALSEAGIHLLRSRFNYKTISYQEAGRVVFKKGFESKRPYLTLIVGIAFASFAVFPVIYLYKILVSQTAHVVYLDLFLPTLLPCFLGVYLIDIALKKGIILQVERGNEKYILRLNDLVKKGQIENLKKYLVEELTYKFIVQD